MARYKYAHASMHLSAFWTCPRPLRILAMMKLLATLCATASLGSQAVLAAPAGAASGDDSLLYTRDGTIVTSFRHEATGSRMDFVNNSGICETTPGVNQYSGYLSVGDNMNMFFWFFESRNSPATAPLALWLNGGPGCSSLIGLFQENGPCHFVNGETTPSLNPNSWNEYANMLYVDQPIGTGKCQSKLSIRSHADI